MRAVYIRVLARKIESGLSWTALAKRAGIPVATWMSGLVNSGPTDDDLRAIAPVLNTTYEWLKYGPEK